MDIIFGRENAESLRQTHTVLDLETIHQDGVTLEVFCLISADKLKLDELPQLEENIKLHNEFLQGYNNGHHEYCNQAVAHLRGKFGGELDTFYDEILKRINSNT